MAEPKDDNVTVRLRGHMRRRISRIAELEGHGNTSETIRRALEQYVRTSETAHRLPPLKAAED